MPINWKTLKAQYIQTSRSSQINSLSLNMTRLQTLATSGAEESVARHLVRESQFFVEWSIAAINLETDISSATKLLSLQRQLSRWKLDWSELWNKESERQKIADIAQHWSEQLQGSLRAIAR